MPHVTTREFAIAAHGPQLYGSLPYVVHLDAVAALAAPFGQDFEDAAYLHDVDEDTDSSASEAAGLTSTRAIRWAKLLADSPGATRKIRKVATHAKLAALTPEDHGALVVKACDRLANVRACIEGRVLSKWQMYVDEHGAFKAAAHRAGLCPSLWAELDELTAEGAFDRCASAPWQLVHDEEGRARTLYHGGLEWDEPSFDAAERGALWLTPEVGVAFGYADQYSQRDGREVKAFHARLRRPLDLTRRSMVEEVFGDDEDLPADVDLARDRSLIERAVHYAKVNGFDGVVHPDSDVYNRTGRGRISIAVFAADQLQFAPLTGDEDESNVYGIALRGAGSELASARGRVRER